MKQTFFKFFFYLMIFVSLISCDESQGNSIKNNLDNTTYNQLKADTDSTVIFEYDTQGNSKKKVRGFQGVPSIGYKGGIYYASWMCGERAEEPGGYITLSSSSDSGKTWNANKFMIIPKLDSARIVDPCFWLDPQNDLHLSWTYINNGMWDGGVGGLWHVKIKLDNNKIFITAPIKLLNGIMNVKPTSSLKDKSIMYFPVNAWNFPNITVGGHKYHATLPEYNKPFVYKYKYDIVTKNNFPLTKIGYITTRFKRTFDEHVIVDLGNDKLVCFLRTDVNGIAFSNSDDGGKTWSRQEEFKKLGQTTSSRFALRRLKSGNLIFVLNNSNVRNNMTAYLSTDNGLSWPFKLLIDERHTSYPDLVEDESGEVSIIYDRDRWGLGQIVLVKLKEEDFFSKSSIDFSKRRVLISKLK